MNFNKTSSALDSLTAMHVTPCWKQLSYHAIVFPPPSLCWPRKSGFIYNRSIC